MQEENASRLPSVPTSADHAGKEQRERKKFVKKQKRGTVDVVDSAALLAAGDSSRPRSAFVRPSEAKSISA